MSRGKVCTLVERYISEENKTEKETLNKHKRRMDFIRANSKCMTVHKSVMSVRLSAIAKRCCKQIANFVEIILKGMRSLSIIGSARSLTEVVYLTVENAA